MSNAVSLNNYFWHHFNRGCVTPKVLANILEAIAEDGEPDFGMLDGFEELSAENQAKIKEAILKGELDEADKTDVSDLTSWSCVWHVTNGVLI